MVTNNIIQRVFQIQVGNHLGTCFTIEYKKKQYLITAMHLFKDIQNKNEEIEIILKKDESPSINLRIKLISSIEKEVDIAILDLQNSNDISPRYAMKILRMNFM